LINEIKKNKKQRMDMIVKGINNSMNKFETKKASADEAYRTKDLQKASKIYGEVIAEMEVLEETLFIEKNKKSIYEKCNFF
jgi:polyribonucleotide nucleotidyltransferase